MARHAHLWRIQVLSGDIWQVSIRYAVTLCTICSDSQLTVGVRLQDAYHAFCAKNNFLSMLRKDVKAREAAAEKEKAQKTQTTLNPHLREKETVVKYTDSLFREAALEWLIATDQVRFLYMFRVFQISYSSKQPIQALEHPSFKNMIDIAARSTQGVKIPNREQTRQEIINTFNRNLTKLRERLNVRHNRSFNLNICSLHIPQSDAVAGRVNLTCDAWQATNTDSYFAVTGHWIEETTPGVWKMQSGLLGFVRMNCAHTGEQLGCALFKVTERLGISHKVGSETFSTLCVVTDCVCTQIGYISCDNAKNNGTMMTNFAGRYTKLTGLKYDPTERRIR